MIISFQDASVSKDVDISGGELDITGEDGDVDAVAKPLVASDHQLMTELSDVPPAQLLDGGSEDMDMVRGCRVQRGWDESECIIFCHFQSDEEALLNPPCGECV